MTVDTDPAATADTGAEPLAAMLDGLRSVRASGRTRTAEWRIRQLAEIERMLSERETEICEALAADLGRPAAEAWLGDIASTVGEAAYARKHVRSWMKAKRVRIGLNQLPGSARVQYEPLGVVLVIGPWNYPVYLTLAPLVAAISAGNCAVVKPSELAPATSRLLADLIPQYVDSEAIKVVEGGAETTQALLALGFDHAFFTGGTEIGKRIMEAAAATLTPVTLELGGKSPVVVAADADLDVAARRIAWVKLMNSGQTCIAPDYVLADRSVIAELSTKIVENYAVFRADQAEPGQRIVNERQFDRLTGWIEQTEGQILTGGGADRDELRIEPTVILGADPEEPAMTDEIFGPILPILPIDSIEAAVSFVNARPKPLALYVFAKSRAVQKQLADSVPAGGVVINHVALHCLVPQLPFGGVGASGMGAYHGWWGFEALSHRKAVLSKTFRPDVRLVYPPYSDSALKWMRRLF